MKNGLKKLLPFHITCCLLLIATCWSCTQKASTEKHQKDRNNIIDVQDKIKEIDMEDTPISGWGDPYILNDYLLISDYKSPDKLVYLFDKNTFKYITCTGDKGQGPGEISNMGRITVNETERSFYLTDHGSQKIFCFRLDSVLSDPFYRPEEKASIKDRLFPHTYQYVNDTLSYGLFWEIMDTGGFKPIVVKWNMKTGEVVPMKYAGHPEIERKRVSFAASVENGIYVECYSHHDLMSICSLEGDLICNVYGKIWDTQTSNKDLYFQKVMFCKDKIVASYWGGDNFYKKENGQTGGNNSDKLLIFDLKGNYLKTLNLGHQFFGCCYDKENNRIIMNFNSDIQFGYLDMEEFI